MAKSVGQYTYKDPLGVGAYGKVYLAKDSVGRRFTIKVIPMQLIANEEEIKCSLLEELEQLKDIEHEKLIKLVDVIKTKNNYYLVSDYHEGVTLQEYLKDNHALNEDLVITMIQDILEVFMECNKSGIIHNNLKPSNIIYEHDQFKLCDFGQSNIIQTFKNENIDVPFNYMYQSPQVLKEQYHTNICDIWSIGILVYQCLYGYTPWFAKKKEDLIYNIFHQPIQFNSQLVQISETMQNFIIGCLQIDEKDRFNWNNIYDNQLIYAHFQQLRMLHQEDKLKFIMNHLRRTIMKEQIDLLQLFAMLDTNGNKLLDFDEFSNLIRHCDPLISQVDIEYIFEKVDTDKSGEISFDEFVDWLSENNINVKLLSQRFKNNYMHKLGAKHIQEQEEPQSQEGGVFRMEQSVFVHPQQNDQAIINNLIESLKQYFAINHVSLVDLFRSYDTNGDQQIDYLEFYYLIKQIDNRILDAYIKQIFQIMDQEKINKINFIQFRNLFLIKQQQQQQEQIVQFEQNPMNNATLQQDLFLFKQQIKQKQINSYNLFSQFDADKDNHLSYQEFVSLCHALGIQQCDALFYTMNFGQPINFIRFRQVLNQQ